jgi:hypothetical protein
VFVAEEKRENKGREETNGNGDARPSKTLKTITISSTMQQPLLPDSTPSE